MRLKNGSNAEKSEDQIGIDTSLVNNMNLLQNQIQDCADIVIQRLSTADGHHACIILVNGLVDADMVQRDVIHIFLKLKRADIERLETINPFPVMQSTKVYCHEEVLDNLFKGKTVMLIDGLRFVFCFDLQKPALRSIEEPTTERILKGHHDGFIESLPKNIALIRSKLSSAKLKVKYVTVGKRSHSDIAILYIEDIANPEIVKCIESKLNAIETDIINTAGKIEQLVSDNPYSMFPQHQSTERPDKAVANLLEGRIILIINSTPVVLILPVDYFQFYQTPDDYNVSFYYGSFIRLLRFFGSTLAVLLPALYIALLTFHYQALPLNLLVPLAESRSRVPFPPIIEALIMEVAFELLREASIRLPASLGPTIGIVGGLVLGQTAVEAGLVSNIMVIVVGITAIATFVVPQHDIGLMLRVSRFIFMINASIFGIVGVVTSLLVMLAHLVSLESYGQPYMQPIAPFKLSDLKDVFIRVPLKYDKTRPDIARPQDKTKGRGEIGDQ